MTTCYAQPYAPAAEQKGPSLVSDQQPAGLYVHLLQKRFAPTAAGSGGGEQFPFYSRDDHDGMQEAGRCRYFLFFTESISFQLLDLEHHRK